jgi:D-3-phosphoglycerate dehydrogenase
MMFQIQTFNKISPLGLEKFPADNYNILEDCSSPDGIILRSHKLQNGDVPDSVLAVARAGAGVNNVPVADLTKRGIAVFNTPGANANAVKELVLAGLLLSARNICQAWQYTNSLSGSTEEFNAAVEGGKKQFKGFELPGRTLGLIGLGAIGVKVANAAHNLGMRVIGFDPAITVKRAWELDAGVEQATNLDALLKECDFISVHVPLLDATHNLLDAKRIKQLKPGCTLLNFSRGEIVDEQAAIAALKDKHLGYYVCDFPSPALQAQENVIALPHLGASTTEAEDNCAVMAVQQLREYLEHGQITNSVNFPEIHLPRQGSARICIANANVPNMVGQVSSILGNAGLNIVEMLNRSRQDVAYTLIDVDKEVSGEVVKHIQNIDGILATRVIA